MSTTTKASAIDHATQVAHSWVNEVARQFDTGDREFAYGVLRAWLHVFRDRLTVEAAAHFAAQLPDLIRGVFYAGWDPSAVPIKYDAEGFAVRLAHDATLDKRDVGKASAAVTNAVTHFLPASHLDKAMGHLPPDVRALLRP
ncbi:hypothetical protein Mycch_1018 [Mycolicibacterium chubuense NBB4]|uniref:DUF2267 domain-containing protein n=1 Tax=Mycolicibacterium chubuense (strain NBB4) TaxID=710421 RepID=I4BEX1_MYCCN|nr:DUF2267 domain-containing protein [Mycolicibacterium chubuense]AFM15828.1 hypothetical protein Mycch_1018 [Mycolicibacterium chubuense NBB4]